MPALPLQQQGPALQGCTGGPGFPATGPICWRLQVKQGKVCQSPRMKTVPNRLCLQGKTENSHQIFRRIRPWSGGPGFPASGPICWSLQVKRGAGLSGPPDENSAKSPVSSGENRESTSKSSDITGLFWLTRATVRTNMLESLGKTVEGPLDENSAKSPMPSKENIESIPHIFR